MITPPEEGITKCYTRRANKKEGRIRNVEQKNEKIITVEEVVKTWRIEKRHDGVAAETMKYMGSGDVHFLFRGKTFLKGEMDRGVHVRIKRIRIVIRFHIQSICF